MRLFIAIPLPKTLHAYCKKMQKQFEGLRKTKDFHLTLQFLGDGIEKSNEIMEALSLFRNEYKGKLALQMMFIEANRDYAPEMAAIAKGLAPDEVQINTPLRPCAVSPLTPEEITAIRQEFSGLSGVVTVYEASRPEVTPLNLEETLRRRPEL